MRRLTIVAGCLVLLAVPVAASVGADRREDLHPRLRSALGMFEGWLYIEGPTTPRTIENLIFYTTGVEIAAASAELEPARARALATGVAGVAEFRRLAGRYLVEWSADRTLVELRATWEALRDAHGLPRREGAKRDLDTVQSRRDPDTDNDLLARLDFVERQYIRIIDYAAELERVPRGERTAFAGDISTWSGSIRKELWQPPLPLTTNAPRDLRRAWRVIEETRPLLQGFLSTPWSSNFIRASKHEAGVELERIRRTRDEIRRAYF